MSGVNVAGSTGLLTAEIRPRRDTYYLVTSEDLQDIKSKGLLADLFMLLAAAAWGSYFSVVISITASAALLDATRQVLQTYRGVFWWAGWLFTFLAVIFVLWSFRRIASVRKSAFGDTVLAPGESTTGDSTAA